MAIKTIPLSRLETDCEVACQSSLDWDKLSWSGCPHLFRDGMIRLESCALSEADEIVKNLYGGARREIDESTSIDWD